MRILILSLLLVSCSHSPEEKVLITEAEQEELQSELKKMDSALTDLTYEVHKPLYNSSEL